MPLREGAFLRPGALQAPQQVPINRAYDEGDTTRDSRGEGDTVKHQIEVWHTEGQVGRRENYGFVLVDRWSLIDGVKCPRAFKFDFPRAIPSAGIADVVIQAQNEGPPLLTLPDGEKITPSEVWTTWSWSSLSLWTGPAPMGARQ